MPQNLVTGEDHERSLIEGFVIRTKRDRFLVFLSNVKRRHKVLNRLAHFQADLDDRFTYRIPDNQHVAEQIAELLRRKGAPDRCYVISENSDLDSRFMPLNTVLSEIVEFQFGTLVSCVPGRLAYYESEESGERYILERDAA